MSTKTLSWGAFVCAAILVQAPGIAAQQNPPHEHPQAAAAPQTDMSATCHAMMAGHEKMMADMKDADERLDGLVAKMTTASGQAKVDATAAAASEIVAQREAMREGSMKMHDEMMSHMKAHMQAGSESMAMCPMMKMGGMKH